MAVDSRPADSLDPEQEYNKVTVDSIMEEVDSKEIKVEDSMETREDSTTSHDQITDSTIIKEDSIQIQTKDSMEIKDSIIKEDSVQAPVSDPKLRVEHSKRLLLVELSERPVVFSPMKPERPSSSQPQSHSIITDETITGIVMDKLEAANSSAPCH